MDESRSQVSNLEQRVVALEKRLKHSMKFQKLFTKIDQIENVDDIEDFTRVLTESSLPENELITLYIHLKAQSCVLTIAALTEAFTNYMLRKTSETK